MDSDTRRRIHQWFRANANVITRPQAHRLGLDDNDLRHLVGSGEWCRLHQGVFSPVAAPKGHHQQVAAALAALGPSTVSSHLSAAWLQGIVERPPPQPIVTVPYVRSARLAGVVVHRSRRGLEMVRYQGLACTTPLRTLLDVARMNPSRCEGPIDRALAGGLVRLDDLERAVSTRARPRPAGFPALLEYLERRGYLGSPQPSVLESEMARLFAKAGIPLPRAEVMWGPSGEYRVDFAYPHLKLAIEVNGYAWHFSPEHQARDHARINQLVVAGWRVLVYTWMQVVRHGDDVLAEIVGVYRHLAS